ncbi:MAG TPA: FAD-binding oxidoreductase [Micromonosporaceae bacterium]|nr:FAD-binding oxidoreductase [Micromonosporaceae bacterium]
MRVDLSPLRDTFRGTLVTPADPGYEAARVMFNTRVRTRPEILARCAGTDDVVAAVRFARDTGLPVSIRSGGHHPCGFSLVDGGVVIDVGGLKRVAFDPDTATVVAGAGCGWRDVDRVTYLGVTVEGEDGSAHGYAPPGGECPTVGVSGYSLGGGYGLLSRRYGLACDHILAATVVDADGRVLRVAGDDHADLLWALRGAGGAGFGVVTDLTYRLDPVPKTIVGGVIAWPIEQATDVLRAYRDLYVGRDDDRLSLFMVLTTDPYPEGAKVIAMYGLYIGPPAQAEAALAPIRRLGRPLFDGLEPMSYWDLQCALGDEIRYGLQLKWRGGYFRDDGFNDDAFDTMVDRFGQIPSGYTMIRFDLLGGGAVGRVPPHATAFVHRSALFHLSAISLWQRDDQTAANIDWVDGLLEAMRPYLSGEVYQNYADEDVADWPHAYYGANYARLQQVKARYDPTDFFHHGQTVRLP